MFVFINNIFAILIFAINIAKQVFNDPELITPITHITCKYVEQLIPELKRAILANHNDDSTRLSVSIKSNVKLIKEYDGTEIEDEFSSSNIKINIDKQYRRYCKFYMFFDNVLWLFEIVKFNILFAIDFIINRIVIKHKK